MINEHENVVLMENIPSAGLEAGDVGVVIHVYENSEAFEVEFLTLEGETASIQTLNSAQVREANPREIPHVREFALAA